MFVSRKEKDLIDYPAVGKFWSFARRDYIIKFIVVIWRIRLRKRKKKLWPDLKIAKSVEAIAILSQRSRKCSNLLTFTLSHAIRPAEGGLNT